MTSKPMQTPKNSQNPATDADRTINHSAADSSVLDKALDSTVALTSATLSTARLVDAHLLFIQQWLRTQAEPLALEAWQWLSAQPLSNYVSAADLQRLFNDWLLSQPISEVMRKDIRDILHTLIYHPVNATIPLSELVDDSQITTLASYIGSHKQQRHILIHTLIGNETFADLLTQTLYHAINDFMETTLDKAGGVGKLMKLGRSSFERATNRNLDEKLQAYLHRNIKDLTRRAEVNAQQHLSNEEVTRLLITGWSRLKDEPVSQLQSYLNDDPDNNSIQLLEASAQHSYNRLRLSPYLHSLVAAAVETWYGNHSSDTIGSVAASLYIDQQAITQLSSALLPLAHDLLDSEWFISHISEMLQAFYKQPAISSSLGLDS